MGGRPPAAYSPELNRTVTFWIDRTGFPDLSFAGRAVNLLVTC